MNDDEFERRYDRDPDGHCQSCGQPVMLDDLFMTPKGLACVDCADAEQADEAQDPMPEAFHPRHGDTEHGDFAEFDAGPEWPEDLKPYKDEAYEWVGVNYPELEGDEFDKKAIEVAAEIAENDGPEMHNEDYELASATEPPPCMRCGSENTEILPSEDNVGMGRKTLRSDQWAYIRCNDCNWAGLAKHNKTLPMLGEAFHPRPGGLRREGVIKESDEDGDLQSKVDKALDHIIFELGYTAAAGEHPDTTAEKLISYNSNLKGEDVEEVGQCVNDYQMWYQDQERPSPRSKPEGERCDMCGSHSTNLRSPAPGEPGLCPRCLKQIVPEGLFFDKHVDAILIKEARGKEVKHPETANRKMNKKYRERPANRTRYNNGGSK